MNIKNYVAIMLLISITMAAAAQGMGGVNDYVRVLRGRTSRSRRVRARDGYGFLVFDDM